MRSITSAGVATLALLTAIMLTITACGSSRPPAVPERADSTAQLDGDYSGSGPGTLKSAVTMPTVDRRISRVAAVTARITYDSTSGIDGSTQLVSGTVFVPLGAPPAGGWPVIAFGHGSTGVQHPCAPSLSSALLGASEAVAVLIRTGYVVALPDYQGLGLDQSYHPYLDATTAGYNMIDAVRAARKLVPGASNRWLAYGASQGGQAAWAANEFAGSYGSGLELEGSVSVAPAADVAGLADLAAQGKLTMEQAAALQWVLVGLKNAHPDLNLDDYRRGIVEQEWQVFSSCQGEPAAQRVTFAKEITPTDLQPASPEATDRLRGYLAGMSLPKKQAQAPMLVVFGDLDQVVAPQWTQSAVQRGCAMGDQIEAYLAPGKGHDDIDGSVAFDWINRHFAGAELNNTCGLPDGVARLSDKPWYAEN